MYSCYIVFIVQERGGWGGEKNKEAKERWKFV